MGILSMFIVNRSGGLIYQQDYSSAAPKLSLNDGLRVASTFVGLSLIMEQLSPAPGKDFYGIDFLEAGSFKLYCIHPAAGIKIFATAEPNTLGVADTLLRVHELYGDYVMKNPFYEMDMPIKCDKFDLSCRLLILGK
eukprot:c11369_g1_i1.p1 GENE.c11369_g1_i1~~c11369_g1_i1.p1  ORF type:complete len:144 (+),score=48.07 c11369_g1_i1:23-433(+)